MCLKQVVTHKSKCRKQGLKIAKTHPISLLNKQKKDGTKRVTFQIKNVHIKSPRTK